MSADFLSRSFTASSTPAFNCSSPLGVVSGTLLVAFQSADVGTLASMTTPSGGADWLPLDSRDSGTATALRYKIWWKIAGASEPSDYVFNQGSGADGTVIVVAVKDAADFTPIFASVASNVSATTIGTPSITPAGIDDFEIRWVTGTGSEVTGVTWIPPAGYIERAEVQSGKYVASSVATKQLSFGGDSGVHTFTASSAHPSLYGVTVAVRSSAVTSQPKAGADSAAVAELASVTVTATRTDSAALSEMAQAARLVKDQAGLVEAAGLTAAQARTDSTTLVEAATSAATTTAADTASTSDSGHVSAAVPVADSGAVADAAVLGLLAGDQVTLTESASKQDIVGPFASDTTSAVEAAVVEAHPAGHDLASLVEQAVVGVHRSATDSASLVEQATAGPGGADGALVGEAATVLVILDRADQVAVADADVVDRRVTVSDGAVLAESALLLDLGREITGVGLPYREWSAAPPRREWLADRPRRTWSASTPHT